MRDLLRFKHMSLIISKNFFKMFSIDAETEEEIFLALGFSPECPLYQ